MERNRLLDANNALKSEITGLKTAAPTVSTATLPFAIASSSPGSRLSSLLARFLYLLLAGLSSSSSASESKLARLEHAVTQLLAQNESLRRELFGFLQEDSAALPDTWLMEDSRAMKPAPVHLCEDPVCLRVCSAPASFGSSRLSHLPSFPFVVFC